MFDREFKKHCSIAYGRKNCRAIIKVYKLVTDLMMSNAELGKRVVNALVCTFLKSDAYTNDEETKTDEQEVK